jgi:hypothetical protein
VIEQKLTRRIALIGPLAGERSASQTTGFPLDPEKMLPVADVILLVVDRDPGATMLFRYTAHGDFGGDTFHTSAEEALEQASFEYGESLGEWLDVPDDVADAHAFAILYARDRLNDRGGGW